jgi:indole-3-glycerol phosphate synthase
VLSVAARDFEKLTVYVDTLPQTAPGIYRAVIGTADSGLETAVDFEVTAPGAGKN